MARIQFNSQEHEPTQPSDPIPAGWYHLTVIESGLVDPPDDKPEQGQHLALTFAVDENEHPQYANRRIWLRLYIQHESEKGRKMSLGKLSSLCRALDILQLDDTDDLLGARVQGKVSLSKDKSGQYPDKNEAMQFKPIGAPPEEKPAPTAAKGAPPPAAKAAPKKGNW